MDAVPLFTCYSLLGTVFSRVFSSFGLVPVSKAVVFLICGMACLFGADAEALMRGAVIIFEMSGSREQ